MREDHFVSGHLSVSVYLARGELGLASARAASAILRAAIEKNGSAAVAFAAAPSQNEFLAHLRADSSIDWRRVTAFHLDEYAGLPASHPASFRRFLRERLMDHVPLAAFHELAGDAPDLEAEAARYQRLLAEQPPELVALGIGENGHLAFIDPGECDFEDTHDVRVVNLDALPPAAGSRWRIPPRGRRAAARAVAHRSVFPAHPARRGDRARRSQAPGRARRAGRPPQPALPRIGVAAASRRSPFPRPGFCRLAAALPRLSPPDAGPWKTFDVTRHRDRRAVLGPCRGSRAGDCAAVGVEVKP